MPTFFGVVELIHLDALKIVFVLTHIATLHVSLTIYVYLFVDMQFDSKFLVSETNAQSLLLS